MPYILEERKQWPEVIFGDGHWIQVFIMKIVENSDGVPGYEVTFRPSIFQIQRFGLKQGPDGDIDEEGFCKRWFPQASLIRLSPDPAIDRWFCDLTFDLKDTYLSKKVNQLKELVSDLQKENTALRASKARLQKDNAMMQTQWGTYVANQSKILEKAVKLLPKRSPLDVEDDFEMSRE